MTNAGFEGSQPRDETLTNGMYIGEQLPVEQWQRYIARVRAQPGVDSVEDVQRYVSHDLIGQAEISGEDHAQNHVEDCVLGVTVPKVAVEGEEGAHILLRCHIKGFDDSHEAYRRKRICLNRQLAAMLEIENVIHRQ